MLGPPICPRAVRRYSARQAPARAGGRPSPTGAPLALGSARGGAGGSPLPSAITVASGCGNELISYHDGRGPGDDGEEKGEDEE